MKREFKQSDVNGVNSGKLKLYDFQGNEVNIVTWNNELGDENINIIVQTLDGIPIGYNKNGYCCDVTSGEYFGTSLYVEDGKNIRDISIKELKELLNIKK